MLLSMLHNGSKLYYLLNNNIYREIPVSIDSIINTGDNSMKIFSIYKVTNKINGKIYIGFTSDHLYNRKKVHKNKAFTQNNNIKFHNALKKYGWEAFEWEVICQSLDGDYLLKIMEPYFIQYYNSIQNGYNITKGGEGSYGFKHSDISKKKMSIKRKGKKFTKNHKENLSKSLKISMNNLTFNSKERILKGVHKKGKSGYIIEYNNVQYVSLREGERLTGIPRKILKNKCTILKLNKRHSSLSEITNNSLN